MKKSMTNIWLRTGAVLMGLLLWFHVATEKTYNHQLTLPINEIMLAENLALAENPPESLTILVTASGKQLLRNKWRASGLRINATQYRPGRYNIDLNTSNTSLIDPRTDLSMDEILSPNSFLLNVDYFDQQEKEITPNIIITPDEGYAVKEIQTPLPSKIKVSGARSVLRTIKSLTTEQKEVSGLRNNLSLTLAVIYPEAYGLTLEPDSIEVNIEIVPVQTRLFKNVPILIYNSPSGKSVSIDPLSVDIEMTGPPKEINLLNKNALVASVDFDKLNGADSAVISIACPPRFRVKRTSVLSVRIFVK